MVALGIHILGEVDEVVGGAAQLAPAHLLRELGDRTDHGPAEQGGKDRRRENAQLRLVKSPAVERDARDQD